MQTETTPIAEEWRPVVGYEGWYSVSSEGRVRRDMRSRRAYAGRILNPPQPDRWHRYLVVRLSMNGAAKRSFLVHCLVAKAFLDPDPRGRTEVNHIDGDKMNNRASNMEWVTRSENALHAIRIGLWDGPKCALRGEASHLAKLSETEVRAIREARGSQTLIAARFGITQSTVSHIRLRKSWKHIS